MLKNFNMLNKYIAYPAGAEIVGSVTLAVLFYKWIVGKNYEAEKTCSYYTWNKKLHE